MTDEQQVKEIRDNYADACDTTELQARYDVLGFMAPLVHVRRKSDDVCGTMQFIHRPRIYFAFKAMILLIALLCAGGTCEASLYGGYGAFGNHVMKHYGSFGNSVNGYNAAMHKQARIAKNRQKYRAAKNRQNVRRSYSRPIPASWRIHD